MIAIDFNYAPDATGRLPSPVVSDPYVAQLIEGSPFFDAEARRPINAFAILANSRTVIEATTAIRAILNGPTSELTGRERECLAIRTAALLDCPYEVAIRRVSARDIEGMSAFEIDSLSSPDVSQVVHWEGRERAIVAITESLVTTENVSDDLLARAHAALGSSLLVEVIFRVGYTRMVLGLLKVGDPPLENLPS